MAKDPESKVTPQAILDAITAGLDPCLIAAMVSHVQAPTFGAVLADEAKVLFGPSNEKVPPPAALSEGDAPST